MYETDPQFGGDLRDYETNPQYGLGYGMCASVKLPCNPAHWATRMTTGICVSLFLILFVIDTLTLPLRWRYQVHARRFAN